jgi:glycosyltransferase involved in cell wall biosynthesis
MTKMDSGQTPLIDSALRVSVLQAGARMHYAVPAILAEAGILQQFYTDVCSSVPPLNIVDRLWPSALRPNRVRRLLGRQLPDGIPRDRVTTTLRSSLLAQLQMRLGRSPVPHAELFQTAIAHNFHGANVLYSNFINSDVEVFQRAQQQGLRTVHEMIISPEIPYILDDERCAFPGLEPRESMDRIQTGTERDRQKWAVSDRILVPSPYVRHTLETFGIARDRIHLVPYGLSEDWLNQPAFPQRGRILFVGSVQLLKGCHYLAEAARLLKRRGVDCEVRVVGAVRPDLASHPAFAGPVYVGSIPRSQIQKEFQSADVLVFPTLCDSFGLVQLEAIAYGVPVIATPHCGSVVRDGVEGFIVPVRNATAIADRVEQLVSDRPLRDRLSHHARQRAADFTWDYYGDRLLAALPPAPRI